MAWQSGNGALANVALDRALEEGPRYSMAEPLRQEVTEQLREEQIDEPDADADLRRDDR